MPSEDFLQLLAVDGGSFVAEVMLVDVDSSTWQLLFNSVTWLRKGGAALRVVAIAYEDGVCKHFPTTIQFKCYYDADWIKRLSLFQQQTSGTGFGAAWKSSQQFINNRSSQWGRLITTTVALCAGVNVLLSDVSTVYFQTPSFYVYSQVDMMFLSAAIDPSLHSWGGHFFADNPNTLGTLSNSVAFYRASEVSKELLLSLLFAAISPSPSSRYWHLREHIDYSSSMFQILINSKLKDLNLTLQPTWYKMHSKSFLAIVYRHILCIFLYVVCFQA